MIQSLDTLDAAVGELVRRRIALTQARARMEAEQAAIARTHEPAIQQLIDDCAAREQQITDYCEANRGGVFGTAKHRETPLAVFGFRASTCVKPARRIKWSEVVDRLLREGKELYLRYKTPEVNRQALLADRDVLSPQECAKLGIQFVTEDAFYLEPKPETASQP
jgi:phage host-nuclease inhibitor protein Gam